MTKEQLISLVHNHVGKNIHESIVELNLGRAYQQIMKESGGSKSVSFSEFIKSAKLTVKQNTIFSYYYVDLPYSVAQIPGPSKGVLKVKTTANNTKDILFVPVDPAKAETHEMDQSVDDTIGYWVEGKIVRFDSNFDIQTKIEEVILSIVPSFEAYEYTDEIYVPAGRDAYLYQLTKELISGKKPDKEINDQSQKTI